MINFNDNLSAILGPTNTGKTYLAFEKLFSYSSGMFGFPLRLLARETNEQLVLQATEYSYQGEKTSFPPSWTVSPGLALPQKFFKNKLTTTTKMKKTDNQMK